MHIKLISCKIFLTRTIEQCKNSSEVIGVNPHQRCELQTPLCYTPQWSVVTPLARVIATTSWEFCIVPWTNRFQNRCTCPLADIQSLFLVWRTIHRASADIGGPRRTIHFGGKISIRCGGRPLWAPHNSNIRHWTQLDQNTKNCFPFPQCNVTCTIQNLQTNQLDISWEPC